MSPMHEQYSGLQRGDHAGRPGHHRSGGLSGRWAHGGGSGEHGEGGRGERGGRGGRGERGGRGGRDGDGGERRGRDGAGRRVLGRGELPLVILALLSEMPRHGYEIIRCIEARCMGAYSPSAGVIYPTLTMLEEQELTQADPSSDEGKRRYAITEAGRAYISEQQGVIKDAFARMDHVARMRARAALPDRVTQAMETLKVALLRHGSQWMATSSAPEHIEQVAAIIETAAAALARLPMPGQPEQTSSAANHSEPAPDTAPDIGQ